MDLQTGEFEEHENLLPTPASVYKMTDPDCTVRALKDDLALNMFLYARGSVRDLVTIAARKLATWLEFDRQGLDPAQPPRALVGQLLDRYAFAATKVILTKVQEFADRNDRKLLVVLFDPSRVLRPLVEGKARYDPEIVDFLQERRFRYFDMNLVHIQDYKDFRIPSDQYLKRYFIGHYSPAGNHFLAYAIKDTVIDWLEPKPITYQDLPGAGRAVDPVRWLPAEVIEALVERRDIEHGLRFPLQHVSHLEHHTRGEIPSGAGSL